MSFDRLKLHTGTRRLMFDLLICFSVLYIFRSYPIPKVVTLSVFLPELSRSSSVCAVASPQNAHRISAIIFFIIFSSIAWRLIGHQRERPHHAAGGDAVGDEAAGDAAAAA